MFPAENSLFDERALSVIDGGEDSGDASCDDVSFLAPAFGSYWPKPAGGVGCLFVFGVCAIMCPLGIPPAGSSNKLDNSLSCSSMPLLGGLLDFSGTAFTYRMPDTPS